ncbi:hypothetical protein DPV78_009240 [Talaromyces pinophilus]|nr:hypothetical protein DPV78_009240 [Talaromyces pinophilus]PCG92734.1 protein of unknown function DUF1996 [Penicillium occitanis (nom. inval.)]PCG98135.1 hypothetical protein PENOC_064560 [Penicillium occitanis (nom. inval.)]
MHWHDYLPTLLTAALFVNPANGFRMHSNTILAYLRRDPVLSPGKVSGHVHAVSGASGFYSTLTTEGLVDSNCTTMVIQDDFSSYWTAPPMRQWPNGSFSALPMTNQLVYYQKRVPNSPISMFPDNFRVIAGDAMATSASRNRDQTSFRCLVFDPPTVYGNLVDSSSGWQRLPTMDCTILTLAVTFPGCWDGTNADSANHRDHVSYNTGPSSTCPSTHPIQIPELTLEMNFDTEGASWEDIYLSSGSASGYGIHADYVFGWKNGGALLSKAMADSTCLAQEDIMDKGDGSPICNTMFSHFNNNAGLACQADSTVDIVHEEVGITRPVPALPGCNLPYDDPGLPSIKPSCPSTSSPVMDAPSRMVSWWNDVPGRDPSLFGVYDAPSLPAISNKPSRAATPSTGTMFLCTEPNWGGHKETWPWNKNVCKTLTGAFASGIGSAGPNTGICNFYSEASCKGNIAYSTAYPGSANVQDFGGPNLRSFMCV